jgi:nucleotide-binding universal stress UspA family protein
MYKTIIAAVDGSDYSWQALLHAKALSEQFEAELWLVHVYPQTSDLLGYGDYEKLVSKRKRSGQQVLDEARAVLGATPVTVEEELLEGPEAEAILTVAKTREADLIVMGSRGFSSLQSLLLGSVSHKVIHHAECAVLVVP